LLLVILQQSVKVNILRGLDKSVKLVNVRRQFCPSRHKHSTGVYLLHYMGILALYSTSIKQFQFTEPTPDLKHALICFDIIIQRHCKHS